jgi:tetratricopeptide (TPR) repeat protein
MSLRTPEGPHQDLEGQLLQQLDDRNLSCSERAWLRCEFARKLEEAGNYEAAHGALGELWQSLNERPQVEGLDQAAAAEVLLRVGVLIGWLGSARQVSDAQERAKDLITESIRIFEALQDQVKVAEAMTDLACCYWRGGSFDDARLILRNALTRLGDRDEYRRAVALIRSAIQAGDFEFAGQAAITIIEEVGDRLTAIEMGNTYERAAALLANSQHPGILARLGACARRIFSLITPQLASLPEQNRAETFRPPSNWHGFHFWTETERYEKYLIARALKDANREVTRASKLLGFPHHQSLIAMLNGRHKDLLTARRRRLAHARNAGLRACEGRAMPLAASLLEIKTGDIENSQRR